MDKHTVKDLGSWSCVSVVERHYTGDISDANRAAMIKIEDANNATVAG